jgi:hypothetical protein
VPDQGPESGDKPDDKPRCPRCGGAARPKRSTTRMNPFLPKTKHLTCSDCGLDYGEDGKPVRP